MQQFLDAACETPLGIRPAHPRADGAEHLTAWLCELFAIIARTPAPLTRDFVRLGRVPHWGDTRRARSELLPHLVYPTLDAGLSTLS